MKQPFKPTNDMVSAANALFMAMAYVQTVRTVIEKIESDLLEKYRYKWDLDKVCGKDLNKRDIIQFTDKYGEYCKDESMTYLISDKDFDHYLTEKHHKVLAAGFKVEYGYCPLLIGEDLERKARTLLIDCMEPVTKFKYDDFFCTTEWKENMNKYIDLTLRMLAPYCKNKLKFA